MADSDSQSERRGRWNWSHALHAALVPLHPLSAFLLPWRAGERDARMAIGLLRADPVRRRSILCAMCYLSVGAAKAMMSGFVVMLLVFAASALFGREPHGWFREAFTAFGVAVLLSAAVLVVLTFVALIFAACVRQKLWIDGWPEPVVALDGRWPPTANREIPSNWVAILIGVPSTIIPILLCLLLFSDPPRLLILASGMVGLIPARWIANRVVALSPEECYFHGRHPGSRAQYFESPVLRRKPRSPE